MSHVTIAILRAQDSTRLPMIVLFALLSGCATDDAFRTQFTQIEQRVTGLGQRVEQLSAGNTGREQATVTFTEKLNQAQREQTALGARVDTLARDADQRAQDARGLRVQIDATEKHVLQLQAQQKDSGDRLSRVELSAAQAALIGQQAATTAHLTASAARAALQTIAEQANGALAALATKSVPVSQSSDVGPDARRGPTITGDPSPRTPAPTGKTPDATIAAPQSTPQPSQSEGRAPKDEARTPHSPTAKSTKPQARSVHTAPPAPAETRSASPGKGLRTIVPRETHAALQNPDAALPASAEITYQLAIEAFSQQRYGEAIQRLEDLQRQHPDDPLAVLSLYRLGEAHYAQQAYPLAATAFQAFLSKQPSGAHVPSILLKLGLIAQTTGNIPDAQQRFTALTTNYPDSQEAAVARTMLGKHSK